MTSSDLKVPGLITDGEFYKWDKGQNFVLSSHFSTSEFSCHCSYPECKEQKIARALITKLDSIREEIKQPLVVTSAFRCVRYQEHLKATAASTVVASKSQHELGNAADVHPSDGKMEGFETICAARFDSIGLAATFLHLDLRSGYRRWKY